MTIAINCWILRNKKLDGIGYFTVNAISRLIKDHPEVHFQILCDKNFTENYFDFKNVSKHRIFPALRHPVLYLYYIEVVLSLFLKKNKPDLALVDLSLKGISGLDLIKQIKKKFPKLPVLVLSMLNESLYAERASLLFKTGS